MRTLEVRVIVDGVLKRRLSLTTMPIRKCDGCLKEYSCRQSLFVHKKKCKSRDLHLEIRNPKLYEFIRWCDMMKKSKH